MEPKPTETISPANRTPKRKRQKAAASGAKRKPATKLTFEPDVDEPQTIESLAAQQRRFLASNKKDWVDVDLPSHG